MSDHIFTDQIYLRKFYDNINWGKRIDLVARIGCIGNIVEENKRKSLKCTGNDIFNNILDCCKSTHWQLLNYILLKLDALLYVIQRKGKKSNSYNLKYNVFVFFK